MISWTFWGISWYFNVFHAHMSVSHHLFGHTHMNDTIGLLRSAWNTHGWWNAASDGASADCGQRVAPLWEVLPCYLALMIYCVFFLLFSDCSRVSGWK